MSKFETYYNQSEAELAEQDKTHALEDLRLDFDTALNNARKQVTSIERGIKQSEKDLVNRTGDVDIYALAVQYEDLKEAQKILESIEAMKTDFIG